MQNNPQDYQIIEAPDGTEIEFPSSMSDDEIAAVMRQQYPQKMPSKIFGINLPSQEQFSQMLNDAADRRVDAVQRLNDRGRKHIDHINKLKRSSWSKTGQEGAFIPTPTDPLAVGAELAGANQGLSFWLEDELGGGQKVRDEIAAAKALRPNDFAKGEVGGGLMNAAITAPLTVPQVANVTRFLPGGNLVRNTAAGIMSGIGWDGAAQMAQGEGGVGARFGQINQKQNALAGFLGGAAGGTLTALSRPLSDGASEFVTVLDGVIDRGTVSPDGLRALERFLTNQGVSLDDVTLGRINSVIQDARQSSSKALALPVRIKDILIDALDDGTGNLRNAVQDHLRGTVVRGGDAGQTVTASIDEDLPAARSELFDFFGKQLGKRARIKSEDQTTEQLAEIGRQGYEPILSKGPQSLESEAALKAILGGPGMTKLKSPLEEIAAGEGLSLQEMIDSDPLRAAHWMQSKARQLSESGDPVKGPAFRALRNRLLKGINDAAPGYDKIRKEYGDEYGNLTALEFGDKFLTQAGKAFEVDRMARAYKELSPAQKRIALLSVRDVLRTASGKGKRRAAPRLGRVGDEQVLESLETVFGARGARVAQGIEEVDNFLFSRQDIDPRRGPRSTPDRHLADRAATNVLAPWRQKVASAFEKVGSDAAAASVGFPPLRVIGGAATGIGRAIDGNPTGRLNDLAKLLEAKVSPAQTHAKPKRVAPPKGPDGKFLSREKAQELGIEYPAPAKKPAEAGFISPDMLTGLSGRTAVGGAFGASAGYQNPIDFDGDGEHSFLEKVGTGAVGLVGGAGALRYGPRLAEMADDVITSPSARRVLDGSSGAGFTNPGRTGNTIYAKSGRKYSMAEGSTMSKVIELARQGKTNTQIDEALGLSPGVAAHYRNVAKTGKPPVDLSPQALPMDEASRMARDVNEVDPSVPMPSHRRSAPREVTNMLGDGPIQYEARSATRGYKTPARLPGDVDISGEAASARYQFNGERFRPYDLNHSRQVIENVMRRHPNLNREVLQEELFYYGEHLSEGFSPADLRINAPDSGNSQEWRALSQYLGENLKMRNPPSASDSPVLTAGIGGRRDEQRIARQMVKAVQKQKHAKAAQEHMRRVGQNIQDQAPPPRQPQNALAPQRLDRGVGDGGEGLALLLGGAAAVGGGGMLMNQMGNRNTQAQSAPGGANAFAQSILSNTQSGLNRRKEGLPFPPSVKPDLSRNMDQMNQAAYLQSKDEMQSLYESLPQGQRLAWNQLRKEMAEELKVKPEEARAGIIAKRLLPNGELQVLTEGQWKTLEFVQ